MTRPNMPDMGVVELLLTDTIPYSPDRFRFWLLTHSTPTGEWAWRKIVMERCLPEPDCDLDALEAVGVLL